MIFGKNYLGKIATLNAFRSSHHQRVPKTPDLIYVPQVWRWMNTKLKLFYLRLAWDPDFSEGRFIYGTSKAISTITDIIHRNKPDELNDLMIPQAKARLATQMNNLTALQRQIIKLYPVDIKLMVPMSVKLLIDQKHRKSCNVALRSLALKWLDDGRALKLILVALQTEFYRDYTRGAVPEWIITLFDILECVQMRDARAVSR